MTWLGHHGRATKPFKANAPFLSASATERSQARTQAPQSSRQKHGMASMMARLIGRLTSRSYATPNELLLTADMEAGAVLSRLIAKRRKDMSAKRSASAYKAARTREKRSREADPVWREMHS